MLAVVGGWSLAIAVVLAHKLIQLEQRNGLPDRDSGVFVTIAQGILEGSLPYRDFWDHKPPGIYYLNALFFSLLPANSWSMHVGSAVVALALLPIFYWLVRSFASPPVAAIGTAVFALFATLPSISEDGNLAETYWQLPTLLTYGALLRYLGSTGIWPRPKEPLISATGYLLLAGVGVACAILLKYQGALHLGGAALAVLLAHLPRLRAVPAGSGQQLIAAGGHLIIAPLGAAAVVLPVAIYFTLKGAAPAMWDQVIIYNRLYVQVVGWGEAVGNFRGAVQWAPEMPHLWALATAAAALGMLKGRGTPTLVLLSVWFLLDAAGATVGGRFYPHYFLLTVPSSAALVTYGLAQTSRLGLRRAWTSAPFAAATWPLAALALGLISLSPISWSSFHQAGALLPRLSLQPTAAPASPAEHRATLLLPEAGSIPLLALGNWRLSMQAARPGPHQRVAEEIAVRTRANDYVYVWGAEAGLYFVSGRRPSSRYIYNYPLIDRFGDTMVHGYSSPRLRARFLADLAVRPPRLIVVAPEHVDTVSVVPQFAQLLARRYQRVAVVHGFHLYERLHLAYAGVWTDSATRRWVFMNRAGAELLGDRPDELVGTRVRDLAHHTHPQRLRLTLGRVSDVPYLAKRGGGAARGRRLPRGHAPKLHLTCPLAIMRL